MENKTEIYILTHKKIKETYDSELYKPLLNGADSLNENFGYLCDNTGDNISKLNNQYSELSGEYWAWKNSKANIIGFCHYRRWFVKDIRLNKLTEEDILNYLKNYDIIVPRKRKTRETVYELVEKRYSINSSVDVKPIEYIKLGKIIKNKYPEYYPTYKAVMNGNYTFLHNMFICNKKLADEYFEFIFNIFDELKNEIDFSSYPSENNRIFGYLSERLLTVFIKKNGLKYKELPLYMSESKIPVIALLSGKYPLLLDMRYKLVNLFNNK